MLLVVVLEACLNFVRLRYRRFGIPQLKFGRLAMGLFFGLLPVLITCGDLPWLVHSVLINVIAAELQLSRAYCLKSGADLQAGYRCSG